MRGLGHSAHLRALVQATATEGNLTISRVTKTENKSHCATLHTLIGVISLCETAAAPNQKPRTRLVAEQSTTGRSEDRRDVVNREPRDSGIAYIRNR